MNYWGKGKSTKPFYPEDEAWETNKQLKIKLGYDINQDCSFWMTFEDWLTCFNTLYYCRVFPPSWSQYCIPGAWLGLFSGGGIFIAFIYSIIKSQNDKKEFYFATLF
jgi:hypothetical protein